MVLVMFSRGACTKFPGINTEYIRTQKTDINVNNTVRVKSLM